MSGCGSNLPRSKSDAFVDDIHADVSCPHRDLLRTTRVSVQARLANENLWSSTKRSRQASDLGTQLSDGVISKRLSHSADTGRASVVAKHVAQGIGPLSQRRAGTGSSKCWNHNIYWRLRIVGGLGQF